MYSVSRTMVSKIFVWINFPPFTIQRTQIKIWKSRISCHLVFANCPRLQKNVHAKSYSRTVDAFILSLITSSRYKWTIYWLNNNTIRVKFLSIYLHQLYKACRLFLHLFFENLTILMKRKLFFLLFLITRRSCQRRYYH